MTRTLLLVIALVSGCFGPSNDALYLRFDDVGALDGAQAGGVYGGFGIGDRVFIQYGNELTEILPTGNTKVAEAEISRRVGASVILQRATGLESTTDFVTYTPLSTERFNDFRATSAGLVAVRLEGNIGNGSIHRSDDGGVTWRKVSDVATPVASESGMAGIGVLGSVGAQAWVQVSGDANLGPNFSATFNGYSVLGDAVTNEWTTGTAYKGPMLGTSSGLALYDLGSNLNEVRTDRLTGVGVTDGAQGALGFEEIPRLHFSMVPMPRFPESSRVLGLDDQERLIIALGNRILRSKTAASRANNVRNEVLRGPGCQQLDTFERGEDRNRPATVTIENRAGRTIRVTRVDFLHRYQSFDEVADGAAFDLSLQEEDHVLITDVTDESCLGFHFPPRGESTITVNAP